MRKKKAIKSIISSLFLQIITVICGFIVPKLIISHYGSATNGLINSITQFLAYITLLQSGFGPVVKSILYKPLANKNNIELANILRASKKFFKNIGYIFIGYLIILCLIYPQIVSNDFDYFFTVSLILIISISTFGEYFIGLTYQLFLEADQKSYIQSNIQIFTTIVNTIVIILLINIQCNIQIVKLISAIIFTLKPILLNHYFKKNYDIKINSTKNDYQIKQKWDGLAQHIAAVIHGNTDVTVITIFLGVTEVSVYSVYMLVVKGVKQLVQSLTAGIDASFGDMYAKNENEKLNISFKKYELIYHTVTTIIFICTTILITPFVSIYTQNITDANYIRPLFAVLITISEFLWGIRLPYSSLTLAVGHFKETRKGAWVEAILNITLSIILVFNFGIIGVAIGTIIAMFIRTIEFMYHTSKYVLKRSIIESLIWIIVIIIEMILCYSLITTSIVMEINNYIEWFKYAVITFCITSIIVVLINCMFNLKTIKKLFLSKTN